MRRFRTTALLVSLLASAASAATYIVPDDARLVSDARAIVVATALSSVSRLDPEGRIETLYSLAVDDVLKGDVRGTTIEVAQWGGRIGDLWFAESGAPTYEPGQRYLVFLDHNKWDEWTTLHLSLGRFRFARIAAEDVLLRDGETFGWDLSGEPHVEHARSASRFLRFVREAAGGRRPVDDYDITTKTVPAIETDTVLTPTFTASQYSELLGGQPARRQTPSVTWHISGSQPGLDLNGASSRGCGAWTNDAGSNVSYSVGSPATTDVQDCNDGVSVIVGNDPHNVISGTFSGSGTVATAFFGGGGTHSFAGESFITISCADVVVQNGVTGSNISQSLLDTILTHEIGHTLGFRHSNKTGDDAGACAAPLPCSGSAIMNSFVVSGIGSTLQAWDRDAVATLYGAGAPCTAPSITGQPSSQSIESGTSATLSVGVSGTSPFTFQWYRGSKGDTTNLVATGSSFNTGALTTTTMYWVRVTNSCGSADSNAATITVTAPCPRPQITSQPQSATVRTTGSRTLGVIATNATSYQWFIGASGNTATPTGTNSPNYSTGPLSSTTSFWARVTNSCGSVNSSTATITVCDPVAITAQPQSQTVTKGRTATMTAAAAGTAPVQFTWYQGTAPDTSLPVATNNSFTTPPLDADTSYWVQVTNNCGTANSTTALITVAPACVAPAITAQPANATAPVGGTATLHVEATGSSLLFEWFRGNAGDTSHPVGTNSDTFTTPALTSSTSFWVRITNSCGLVNSAAAIVTVTSACLPPSVTTQPASMSVRSGSSATLTVVATGDAPLTYQWYAGAAGDTTSPVGTNSATLTTSAITATSSFWVRVSNSCATVDSNAALVSISDARRMRAIRR